jgi:hypothetical protein
LLWKNKSRNNKACYLPTLANLIHNKSSRFRG